MKEYSMAYIERLLEKFFEGTTTEQEEQELSEFFRSADRVPEKWQTYKQLFGSFDTDAYDFSDEEIQSMLTPAPPQKKIVPNWLRWAAAACVVAALAMVGLKHVFNAHSPSAENGIVVAQSHIDAPSPSAKVPAAGADVQCSSVVSSKTTTTLASVDKPPLKKPVAKNRRVEKGVEQHEAKSCVSTAELLETVQVLTMNDAEGITITASPQGSGFLINAVCADQRQINRYELTRCDDGTSLQLRAI